MLALDATVIEVLTSSSDATIVRSILIPSLCLRIHLLHRESLVFTLVEEELEFVILLATRDVLSFIPIATGDLAFSFCTHVQVVR